MSKIPHQVKILGLVSLFNDIASEMIYPIVPIFLTSVLGAPVAAVGLIEGAAESVVNISKTYFGWLSDKLKKRKIFVALGYSFSTISKPFLALAFFWPIVLIARVLDRFGKGVRTSSRDAMIADFVDEKNRGRAYGLHRSMDSAGAVLGPIIALVLMYFLPGQYRLMFILAAIPAALGVLLLLFFIKEKRTVSVSLKTGFRQSLSFSQMSQPFKIFLLISIIFSLGNSTDVFLILRAKDLGLATAAVILIYVIYNILYTLFSYPAGIISDKIGRKKVYFLGLLIFAAVYLGFGFANKSIYVWFLFAIYGFYIALTDGVSKAYVVDLTPKEMRATSLGFYKTLIGFAGFFASLIGGVLWDYFGAQTTFFYGAIMALLACSIFVLTRPNNLKKYS